ncbi:MBOAT family protein [Lacrimispora amygdalina]|uniref:MBOAT family protein n=1 Tax=Lacrimispora amygdalina TaxID=253257 RepID=A0A3E2N4S7_9FIRM|nr:MBOAT family O-acyltransferase [Clostridium indicum]RFZ75985.1 MBOAT family protein [Clostridium indicum]
MVFASPFFLLLFFPIVLVVYFLIDPKYRNFWLFVSSLIFYSWGGVQYTILMFFSIIVNYLLAKLIDIDDCKHPKRLVVISIILNLGILGFFKYFNFLINGITHVIRFLDSDFSINVPNIPLPIGISFFTFQIMSYVIDVYRKDVKSQKKFVNLGLYIMLFPQLIAGPIVRYIDIENEINERRISIDDIRIGIKRFITGLAKKVFLANFSAKFADAAFTSPYLNTPLAWLGIVSYSMQIFFDFSGYSDMAIGMGRIFGFHFLENFNYPYISKSIQEFWRRWHISLSTWFKDYLYIPLGGNRKGIKRTYINNIIVFFCTGLWHGAALNFIVWGLYHGAFLIVERMGLNKLLSKMPKIFGHIYTILVFMIGWVFFRANTVIEAIEYIKKMFVFDMKHMEYFYLNLDSFTIFMVILGVVLSTPIVPLIKSRIKGCYHGIILNNLGIILVDINYLLLFIVSIVFVVGSKFNPFIYFRF